MRVIALLVVATALASPAAAQTTTAGRYSVAFAMTDDGKVVDAPSLTIARGGSARMQIDGRYRIDVTLSPLSNNQMQLETIISRPEAGEWVVVGRPAMTLAEDGQASLRVADAGWDVIEVGIQPEESLPRS